MNEQDGERGAGLEVVVVLAHLMDGAGNLNDESQRRVAAAVSFDKAAGCDYYITTGWAYRPDSDIAIADVFAKALISEFGVDSRRVLVDRHARDTVGDAFFVRRRLGALTVKRIIVVTSDYHAERTRLIFERFFSPGIVVEVVGAFTGLADSAELKRHEAASIEAFNRTFQGVDFASDHEVLNALCSRHPFYNGQNFDRLDPDELRAASQADICAEAK